MKQYIDTISQYIPIWYLLPTRENSDIQVEKPGKQHFNQMIKVKGSNN